MLHRLLGKLLELILQTLSVTYVVLDGQFGNNNVVVIVKTNLQTQAQAHVILFSSDLDLTYDLLIDYYSLRFQIEFNFVRFLGFTGCHGPFLVVDPYRDSRLCPGFF